MTTISSSSPSSCAFPFDHVVITFPDQAAAQAAETGPLPALQARYNQCCNILATTDPYGARVGSGGGSLAALAYCREQQQQKQQQSLSSSSSSSSIQNGNILILHAGGESSRCPTQMVLGKAWTSLPSTAASATATATAATTAATTSTTKAAAVAVPRILTPIELWLDLAQKLFTNLSHGSIVIAASDTLLQLFDTKHENEQTSSFNMMDFWDSCPSTAVVGLAVPAPLETAQNHGVYDVWNNKDDDAVNTTDDNNKVSSSSSSCSLARPCHGVYQKPTRTQLEQHCHPFLVQDEFMAWIDTGVVVFLPKAATALYQLAYCKDLSRVCTWHGIQEAWQQQQQQQQTENSNQGSDIETFAKRVAVKVDLYTHMLQALRLASSDTTRDGDNKNNNEQTRFDQYRQQHLDLPNGTCRALWKALSNCPLFIAPVSHGHFLHLGTTLELQEFLLQGSSSSSSSFKQAEQVAVDRRSALCRQFGRDLGLTRRLKAFTLLPNHHDDGEDPIHEAAAVLYHCILSSQYPNSHVGAGSIVEHSSIETGDQPLVIGNNCLVSGLRPIGNPPYDAFVLPDGMVVQMLALSKKSGLTGDDHTNYVYMLLGVEDGIKKRTSLYGRSWKEFLDWSGLPELELWDEGSPQLLWTARLHPIVSSADKASSFDSMFSWISSFLLGTKDRPESWAKWRQSRRLSLAQIRDEADASLEFSFREDLATRCISTAKIAHLQTIRQTLMQREHQPVDFRYAIAEYAANGCIDDILQVLLSLVDAAERSLCENKYDVCGRSFMIQSGIFYELDDLVQSNGTDPSGAQLLRALSQSAMYTSLLKESLPSVLQDVTVVKNLSTLVRGIHKPRDTDDRPKMKRFGEMSENIAHAMTMRCVCGPRRGIVFPENSDVLVDQWVVAKSGARIDFSGGWSDTPPICCEYGSAVTGVAVAIDGKMPLSCACRIVSGSQGIRLLAESRDINTEEILFSTESSLVSFNDIGDFHNPTSDCALLKCALVCLGLTTPRQIEELGDDPRSFQNAINSFCKSQENCGLEIVATSLLPHGSGLGTSSIIGGCVLVAVGKCIGRDFLKHGSSEDLADAVLVLEQQLTTGGGFQDQVNGLIGGMKTVRCIPHTFPIKLTIERLKISPSLRTEFDSRVILAFTGKTRLAKNILRNVLTRWSRRTPEIVDTASRLVSGAEKARESIESGDFEALAKTLNEYWDLKKIMAGPDSGVEPPFVKNLVSVLEKKRLIIGSSLCGAGGGGFLALVMDRGVSCNDIQTFIHSSAIDLPDITFHECKLSDAGCTLDVFPKGADPYLAKIHERAIG